MVRNRREVASHTPVGDAGGGRLHRRRFVQLAGLGLTAGALGFGGAGTATASGHHLPIGGGDGYATTVSRSDATYEVGTAGDLLNALASAGSGDVVYVVGEIRVGTYNRIQVPDGVTLASGRGEGDTGTLRYTGGCAGDTNALVVMNGDSRLTGLEVAGPWNGQRCGTLVRIEGGAEAEIDNCHLHNGGYGNVLSYGRLHFHHNTCVDVPTGGVGYGVSVSDGRARIEHNYFNNCRHAVACGGARGTSYVCQYNHFGPQMIDHVIDVHDPGGRRFEIRNNIVETVYEDVEARGSDEWENAVAMRGYPTDVTIVENNWFWNPHEPTSSTPGSWSYEAVIQPLQGSWTNMVIRDNHYGEDADVTYADIIPGYTGQPGSGSGDPGAGGTAGDGPTEPADGPELQLVPTGGESVSYSLVVDGGVTFVETGDHNAGDADEKRTKDDGTVTVEGATGDTTATGGDTFVLGGDVLAFQADGPLDVTLDGEDTSVEDLDAGPDKFTLIPDGSLVRYELTVDGAVTAVTEGEHDAGDADQLVDNGDGTVTIEGATGETTGDMWRFDGEVLDLRVDGSANTWINGEAVSPEDFDGAAADGPPTVGESDGRPTDPDGDGDYEDVDGDGEVGYGDTSTLFNNFYDDSVRDNAGAYDFNDNGRLDFQDIVALLDEF